MQDWVALIQTVGFPIFVSLWLMRTLDRRLARIEDYQMRQLQLNASIVRTLDIPEEELNKCLPPGGQ